MLWHGSRLRGLSVIPDWRLGCGRTDSAVDVVDVPLGNTSLPRVVRKHGKEFICLVSFCPGCKYFFGKKLKTSWGTFSEHGKKHTHNTKSSECILYCPIAVNTERKNQSIGSNHFRPQVKILRSKPRKRVKIIGATQCNWWKYDASNQCTLFFGGMVWYGIQCKIMTKYGMIMTKYGNGSRKNVFAMHYIDIASEIWRNYLWRGTTLYDYSW